MLYLGLDLSTQSLSGVVIDTTTGEILTEKSLNYAENFPAYKTENGFIRGENNAFYSYPELYLETLDALFEQFKDMSKDISAISLSGHQHASVYLNNQFESTLGRLDSSKNLKEQLSSCFSRNIVPIWMDNSTSDECAEMDQALEGSVSELSGSLYCERFTAAQIRKFFKQDPDSYAQTATIHLASSFTASILAGQSLAIDTSDGAGMNLMNLASGEWDTPLLEVCAPDLKNKLPQLAPANSIGGKISPYFVKKYGFSESCKIVLASGDNPNSLIGCGAAEPGTVVMSMGTSDTFFGAIGNKTIDTKGVGHIFGNPAGGYMSLICFRNGSLSRETALKTTGLDWQKAEKMIAANTPYQGENFLPYLVDEMYPEIPAQISEELLNSFSAEQALVGVVEGLVLNVCHFAHLHAEKIDTIRLTGGASKNSAIAQMIADIFQAKVERIEIANSAALGAAMRAANAHGKIPWSELNAKFASAKSQLFPRKENSASYQEKLAAFAKKIS